MTEEEIYKAELEKSGVDLPELKDKKDSKDEVVPKKPEPKDEEDESDDDESDDKDSGDSKGVDQDKSKKRSIYDDYKSNKKELRSEKELRTIAETERDELKAKLEALNNADTKEEKSDAIDDLDQYAAKYESDPAALKELKDIILKGIKSPEIDKDLKETLGKFEKWQKDNVMTMAKSEFETEFTSMIPVVKQMFPNVSESDLSKIKSEVDKIAHSKGWEDKDMDYILFKHKTNLEKFVSPKKKGLESTDTNAEGDNIEFDFDPNADLSKMNSVQLDKWYQAYNKAAKSEGLMKDGEGRMSIL